MTAPVHILTRADVEAFAARVMARVEALERTQADYAELVDAAAAVCAAIGRDDSGTKDGGWRDGNGGLLSRDTIRANDRLRQVLGRVVRGGGA
jgi:hypothetical protein